jgi:hypothetical protein
MPIRSECTLLVCYVIGRHYIKQLVSKKIKLIPLSKIKELENASAKKFDNVAVFARGSQSMILVILYLL